MLSGLGGGESTVENRDMHERTSTNLFSTSCGYTLRLSLLYSFSTAALTAAVEFVDDSGCGSVSK